MTTETKTPATMNIHPNGDVVVTCTKCGFDSGAHLGRNQKMGLRWADQHECHSDKQPEAVVDRYALSDLFPATIKPKVKRPRTIKAQISRKTKQLAECRFFAKQPLKQGSTADINEVRQSYLDEIERLETEIRWLRQDLEELEG